MSQRRSLIQVGVSPSGVGSSSSTALSLAATYLAYSFVTSESGKTLSKVHFYPSSVTGSLAGTDVVCEIYADSAGAPTGAALATSTTLSAAIVAATWNSSSGFSLALTQGTQYWAVFHNANATPATNFPTLRFIAGAPRGNSSFTAIETGWAKKLSTDSGATWAGSSQTEAGGWMLEYDDGTFEGFPTNDIAAGAVGVGVYGTRESGVLFTMHPSGGLSVRSVGMIVTKTSSPTGTARAKIYEGTTLVATSLDIPITSLTGSNYYAFLFASPVTMTASTAYRVVLAESTQADASANRYNVYEYTVKNTAGAKALGPLLGTWQRTYYDGSVWTETDTAWPVIALLLDSDAPFVAASSGIPMMVCE